MDSNSSCSVEHEHSVLPNSSESTLLADILLFQSVCIFKYPFTSSLFFKVFKTFFLYCGLFSIFVFSIILISPSFFFLPLLSFLFL